MDPMKPLHEPVSPRALPAQPSRRRIAMDMLLSAGGVVLTTAFLWSDGFSWLIVLTLIVAAVTFGMELGNLLRRRRDATSP